MKLLYLLLLSLLIICFGMFVPPIFLLIGWNYLSSTTFLFLPKIGYWGAFCMMWIIYIIWSPYTINKLNNKK